MLLAFMYHHVGKGKHANTESMFQAHLRFLKERYPIVLPGDPLHPRRLSLMLSFDDASYSFYHSIFPLLKAWGIRALLAVPVRYVVDTTECAPEARLAVPYALAMQDGIFDTQAPLCTWKELQEMVDSGYVEVASHSYMHSNLTFPFVSLEREVVLSKEILESRLSQPVRAFVYPFGRTTPAVQEYVSQHYPYTFRIGSALNYGWGKGKVPLRRVPGDQMETPEGLCSRWQLLRYLGKAIFT